MIIVVETKNILSAEASKPQDDDIVGYTNYYVLV